MRGIGIRWSSRQLSRLCLSRSAARFSRQRGPGVSERFRARSGFSSIVDFIYFQEGVNLVSGHLSLLDSYFHRALWEVVLVGALTGLVGVHVVLRRLAFTAMAMTHVTFPGVVVASLVGVNLYFGGIAAGLVSVLAIASITRQRAQDRATATGIVLATGFALGVALLSAQNGSSKDLSSYLVGSIVTVQAGDIFTTAGMGLVVTLILTATHKELIVGAFDPLGSRAMGHPTSTLDLLMLLIIEAVVVSAVPVVGSVLAIALLVAPAAAARLWTDRIWLMTVLAIAISVASGVGGLLVSRQFTLATGGTITLLAALIIGISLTRLTRYSGCNACRGRGLLRVSQRLC